MVVITKYNNGEFETAATLVSMMSNEQQLELVVACADNDDMYRFFFIDAPTFNHKLELAIK